MSGHRDALARITAWLGQWPHGAAPYWVKRAELGARRPAYLARPSWCYGALGVLRAQQLAALSIGDAAGCARAADAARSVLADPSTPNLTRDASLCHGWAGLAVTAAAIAADAPDPGAFTSLVKALGGELSASAGRLGKAGFLEGRAWRSPGPARAGQPAGYQLDPRPPDRLTRSHGRNPCDRRPTTSHRRQPTRQAGSTRRSRFPDWRA